MPPSFRFSKDAGVAYYPSMTHLRIGRPEATEHAPHFSGYVDLVSEADIVSALEEQREQSLILLRRLDEAKAAFRYAPDKWTVKEVIGHLIDTERVLTFRALFFARNNMNPVPGYDQDVTAKNAAYSSVQLSEILDEYDCVRRATIHLFRRLDRDAWMRRGIANQNEITVRALAYVTLGHKRHHLGILANRHFEDASDIGES